MLGHTISSWRQGTSNLLATWISLTLALNYLDVAIWNSSLLASLIVTQSAVGCLILIRANTNLEPSIPLLLGPGLAIGGPISFAIFQVVGRGTFGTTVTFLLGLLAASKVCTVSQWDHGCSKVLPLFAYVFGLVALAMSSGYIWLFLVACSLIICGYFLSSEFNGSAQIRLLVAALTSTTLLLARSLRSASWWLITDDIVFLETVSQHIAKSGPLADWGAINFLKYHWLSYGWAGMLDSATVKLEPMVALARVMPVIYSLILASSLIMLAGRISKLNFTSPKVLFAVGAVILSPGLDWSAASTAGGLAVLAASTAIMVEVLNSNATWWTRCGFYLLLALILGLTKFPSVLAFLSLIVATESLSHLRLKRIQAQLALTTLAVGLTCVVVFLTLPYISRTIGGFSIVWSKNRGDELSQRGIVVQLSTLFARRSREILLVALSWIVFFRGRVLSDSTAKILLLSLAPLLVVGVIVEASVNGYANTVTYFSDPNFLLSGIIIISLLQSIGEQRAAVATSFKFMFPLLATLSILSEVAYHRVPGSVGLVRLALRMTEYSSALVICIFVFGLFVTGRDDVQKTRVELLVQLSVSVALAAAVTGGIVGKPTLSLQAINNRDRASAETALYLGSSDAKAVGEWISSNVPSSAVIGTNHLQDADGFLGDYSLAMWSRREFLVLGPKLFNIEVAQSDLIELSLRFGSNPTNEDLQLLVENNVDWFIIDLKASPIRDWRDYGKVLFRTGEFWVLELNKVPINRRTD